MGRVYDALIKSGKWNDQPGSVARPDPAKFQKAVPTELARDKARRFPAPVPAPVQETDPIDFEMQQPPSVAVEEVLQFSSPIADLPIEEDPTNFFRLARLEPQQTSLVENCPAVRVNQAGMDPHIVAFSGDSDLTAERYQTLAVRVFNLTQKRALKTVLVTSAVAGEGKTTVATSLAALLAKPADRRVLLIDSDLRQPSVAKALGVSLHSGWSEVLEGKSVPGAAIVRLEPLGLYLIAGGAGTGARQDGETSVTEAPEGLSRVMAEELFASSRPEELIRELERHFDLIVIDSPPILDFAEAQRLASIADGTVVVTVSGKTHCDAVRDAVKLVPKDRRLGIVLTQSSVEEEKSYGRKGNKQRPSFSRSGKRK